MAIVAIKSRNIIQLGQTAQHCYCCNSDHAAHFYFSAQYLHIGKIPFLLLGKSGYSICIHCLQYLSQTQMPIHLKLKMLIVFKSIKGPGHIIGAGRNSKEEK